MTSALWKTFFFLKHQFSVADVDALLMMIIPTKHTSHHWTFKASKGAAAWPMPLVREAITAASREEQSVSRATGLHGLIFPGLHGVIVSRLLV